MKLNLRNLGPSERMVLDRLRDRMTEASGMIDGASGGSREDYTPTTLLQALQYRGAIQFERHCAGRSTVVFVDATVALWQHYGLIPSWDSPAYDQQQVVHWWRD